MSSATSSSANVEAIDPLKYTELDPRKIIYKKSNSTIKSAQTTYFVSYSKTGAARGNTLFLKTPEITFDHYGIMPNCAFNETNKERSDGFKIPIYRDKNDGGKQRAFAECLDSIDSHMGTTEFQMSVFGIPLQACKILSHNPLVSPGPKILTADGYDGTADYNERMAKQQKELKEYGPRPEYLKARFSMDANYDRVLVNMYLVKKKTVQLANGKTKEKKDIVPITDVVDLDDARRYLCNRCTATFILKGSKCYIDSLPKGKEPVRYYGFKFVVDSVFIEDSGITGVKQIANVSKAILSDDEDEDEEEEDAEETKEIVLNVTEETKENESESEESEEEESEEESEAEAEEESEEEESDEESDEEMPIAVPIVKAPTPPPVPEPVKKPKKPKSSSATPEAEVPVPPPVPEPVKKPKKPKSSSAATEVAPEVAPEVKPKKKSSSKSKTS